MKKGIFELVVYLIDLYQKKKQKKIKDLKKYKGDFKKSLNRLNREEDNFFNETGIRTSYNMIPKHIDLKNEPGCNFTWKMIGKANSYLKYSEDKLEVHIPRWDRLFFKVILSIGLVCFTAGMLLMTYIGNNINAPSDILYLFCTAPLFAFSIWLMFIAEPYIFSRLIEKRLSEVRRG